MAHVDLNHAQIIQSNDLPRHVARALIQKQSPKKRAEGHGRPPCIAVNASHRAHRLRFRCDIASLLLELKSLIEVGERFTEITKLPAEISQLMQRAGLGSVVADLVLQLQCAIQIGQSISNLATVEFESRKVRQGVDLVAAIVNLFFDSQRLTKYIKWTGGILDDLPLVGQNRRLCPEIVCLNAEWECLLKVWNRFVRG